jgi:hypothetical protein
MIIDNYDKFFNSAYMKSNNNKVNFHHFYGDVNETDFILNTFTGYFEKSPNKNNIILVTNKMPYPRPLFLVPGNYIVFSTSKYKKGIENLYIYTYRGFTRDFKVDNVKDMKYNKYNADCFIL